MTLADARKRPGPDTLGHYWQDEIGNVWRQVSYTDQPTASFRRVDDESVRLSGVVNSLLLGSLRLLSVDGDAA